MTDPTPTNDKNPREVGPRPEEQAITLADGNRLSESAQHKLEERQARIRRIVSGNPATMGETLRRARDERFQQTRRGMELNYDSGSTLLNRPVGSYGDKNLRKELPGMMQRMRDLDPRRRSLIRRLALKLPFGNMAEREMIRMQSGRQIIDELKRDLEQARTTLKQDYDETAREQDRLRKQINSNDLLIQEHQAELTLYEQTIGETELPKDWRNMLEAELLNPSRRELADLHTSQVAARQNLAASEILQTNNLELIGSLQSASTTGIAVIESALFNASVLGGQRHTLDMLDNMKRGTEALMLSNAQELARASGEITARAGKSLFDLSKLEQVEQLLLKAERDQQDQLANVGTALNNELRVLRGMNERAEAQQLRRDTARELRGAAGPLSLPDPNRP